MQTDGLARKEGMAALVVAPGGEKEELALAGGGPDYYTLRFSTPADGFYHVVTKNTGNYVLDKEGNISVCLFRIRQNPDNMAGNYRIERIGSHSNEIRSVI